MVKPDTTTMKMNRPLTSSEHLASYFEQNLTVGPELVKYYISLLKTSVTIMKKVTRRMYLPASGIRGPWLTMNRLIMKNVTSIVKAVTTKVIGALDTLISTGKGRDVSRHETSIRLSLLLGVAFLRGCGLCCVGAS